MKKKTAKKAVQPDKPKTQPKPAATAVPVAKPKGDRVKLTVVKPCALGNGDRKPGDVLAVIECEAGVRLVEVINAINNQSLIKLAG